MKKYKCPHCNEDGISFIAKMSLGAWGKTRCVKCKKWAGMPFWSIFSMLPMIFIIWIGMFTGSVMTLMASPVFGVLIAIYICDRIALHPLKGK